jgi:anthranilate synthase component II
MARILVVDNYDSFTYNLVQELAEVGAQVAVVRNDEWTLEQIRAHEADGIVISPGPGSPMVARDVGVSLQVIEELGATTPILGVCLGHQCIGQVFGGKIVRAPELVHGKTSQIHHQGDGVLEGLSQPFEATRYHSLIVEEASLPAELEITARTSDGLIMGLRHRELAIEGVQFHPESILTREGMALLGNFVRRASAAKV